MQVDDELELLRRVAIAAELVEQCRRNLDHAARIMDYGPRRDLWLARKELSSAITAWRIGGQQRQAGTAEI